MAIETCPNFVEEIRFNFPAADPLREIRYCNKLGFDSGCGADLGKCPIPLEWRERPWLTQRQRTVVYRNIARRRRDQLNLRITPTHFP